MSPLRVSFGLYFLVHVLHLSSSNEYKLPSTIQPFHYDITLYPNFTNFTFKGQEEISINISKDHFSSLDSNSNDLFHVQMHIGPQMTIKNASLSMNALDGNPYVTTQQTYNNNTQIILFIFNLSSIQILDAISSNNATYALGAIQLEFSGILRNDLKGFYVSQYTFENTIIYNAVTQFESTDARRAFPCFDEPSFKAQFTITMIAPSICTVLSNMNVQQITAMDNSWECKYTAPESMHMSGNETKCKMVQFATSPSMSTYLVAFVVGLYNNVTNHTINGLRTSIYYPMDSDANHAQYALDAALKILPLYEELFGVDFPLPKIDCIALSDFAAGAMENWGLVTYRRTALLVDPLTSSESALRWVVIVIAHEFAHQWFGNIVTMKWWNDVWLNEGFASFVEYIGTNYSSPEFEIWNFFLISTDSVLSIDASYYTHAIQSTVNDPNEIDTLFDRVTYDKGMAVIRMLYTYIGSDAFMNGIQSYLQSYVYDNADTQQLWDALGGDTIINMMNTFVQQPGFPVLYVSIQEMNNKQIVFNVTQERMTTYGPSFDVNNDEYSLKYDTELVAQNSQQLWILPLRINTMSVVHNHVMETRVAQVTLPRIKDEDGHELYVFNEEMSGFYRVLYDEQLFMHISDSWLNGDYLLSEFDKYSILSDQHAFSIANYISAADYLTFLSEISHKEARTSPSFLIWDIIIASLIEMDSILCETHTYDIDNMMDNFRSYALDILSHIWSVVGKWKLAAHDSENIINLRALLISALVRFGDETTIRYGYTLLKDVMKNGEIVVNDEGEMEGIDANILKQVIECALSYEAEAMNDGSYVTVDILDALRTVYDELNSEYQRYILGAIGAVYVNAELTTKALEFVLQSGTVRDQDKIRALYSLRRCYGREYLWEYLTQNGFWDALFNIYGLFSAQDLTEIANTFASRNYYETVYDFYYVQNGHKTSSNERSVNETLENIQINTEWIANNYEDIKEFLLRYIDNVTTREPSDYEWSQDSMMRYFWIGALVVFVLCCFAAGFVWLWKKQYVKLRMLQSNTTTAMLSDADANNNQNINSINDEQQYDRDDDTL